MVKRIKSRYGDERIISITEDGRYKVQGRSLYTRHGDGLFDFEGGPCYIVGDRLLDIDNTPIIEKIEIDKDIVEKNYAGCIITVKEKNVKVSKKFNKQSK
jgi:hypothetical protein